MDQCVSATVGYFAQSITDLRSADYNHPFFIIYGNMGVGTCELL